MRMPGQPRFVDAVRHDGRLAPDLLAQGRGHMARQHPVAVCGRQEDHPPRRPQDARGMGAQVRLVFIEELDVRRAHRHHERHARLPVQPVGDAAVREERMRVHQAHVRQVHPAHEVGQRAARLGEVEQPVPRAHDQAVAHVKRAVLGQVAAHVRRVLFGHVDGLAHALRGQVRKEAVKHLGACIIAADVQRRHAFPRFPPAKRRSAKNPRSEPRP